jgi:hypothetical protein
MVPPAAPSALAATATIGLLEGKAKAIAVPTVKVLVLTISHGEEGSIKRSSRIDYILDNLGESLQKGAGKTGSFSILNF